MEMSNDNRMLSVWCGLWRHVTM